MTKLVPKQLFQKRNKNFTKQKKLTKEKVKDICMQIENVNEPREFTKTLCTLLVMMNKIIHLIDYWWKGLVTDNFKSTIHN